ncbi:glycosyltransferase involved in cell wall biosynthesis [Paenibacillus castaneae]|uniref:glycosyltransferase family 4 protein n=1 Tax=Paenibacillus castaneae TaxID=474957 RepID=UPI000C9B98F1|nr:glycosyltransferase family 4 protein [Paenibacillus castaneae]NIK75372.1 glycosyltransferase involved in cell wall biosynthesis [Paenibacillus castaneae]
MRQPRRLWILTNEYEPYIIGGLGTAVTNLTKAYVNSNINVTVLSQGSHPPIRITKRKRLSIVYFPARAPYYSVKTRQFNPAAIERWIVQQGYPKPDGIHIHSLQFVNVATYYQSKLRIPIIYTSHSLVNLEKSTASKRKRLRTNQQALLLKKTNKITVPSRSELVKLKKLYPFVKGKTTIVSHGIVLRKSGARASRRHLLYVGRLVPLKGIEPLLNAISKLKQSGNKVRLDLVGTGSRSYVNHLKALARKLGISSEVRWLGFQSQSKVQKIYATYGAVVMPSSQESFGLVALEALASGIPLVSTRAGGLAEFVNSSVAQTIPRADSTAIAASIKAMWSNKPLTDKRVAAGRRLASKYQWPQAANRYKKLFLQLQGSSTTVKRGRINHAR